MDMFRGLGPLRLSLLLAGAILLVIAALFPREWYSILPLPQGSDEFPLQGVTILQLYAQGAGIGIPAQVMSMLPYLATILVLTVIAVGPWKGRLDAPACLGIPFRPST